MKRTRAHLPVASIRPFVLATIFLQISCAVGPDYQQPEVPEPETYDELRSEGLILGAARLEGWWERLGDPLLSELIELAVGGSPNLRETRARLSEARARRGVARAELLPTIGGDAGFTRSQTSVATDFGGGFDPPGGRTNDLFSAGFDAGWEIDVFGGLRRGTEAAQAELEAAEASVGDALVSLAGEVALVYVEIRTNQRRAALARENLEIQEATAERVRIRFDAGLATNLDIQEARAAASRTRATVPALDELVSRAIRRLEVLAGQAPGTLRARLEEAEAIPAPPDEVVVDVPAEMLRRRPDLRALERQVAAQSARIGVASAELYPKFRLSGTIGVSANDFAALFAGGAGTASFGPSISWRLFEFGAIRREIEIEDARFEQAVARYEAGTLAALEEVENAINAYYQDRIRLEALRDAERSRRAAVEAAEVLVETGLERLERVLDAQRDLVSAQDSLALGRAEITSDVISLYKALGGGW